MLSSAKLWAFVGDLFTNEISRCDRKAYKFAEIMKTFEIFPDGKRILGLSFPMRERSQ